MRFLAIVALVLLAGCSGPTGGQEPLPAAWRGRDLNEPGWANATIEPGWTFGLEYQFQGGQKVAWDWVVIAPVQQEDPVFTAYVHFQLVRQEGTSWRALAAQDAQEGRNSRTIVQAGTHQIDWMNEWTVPVIVAYKVPAGGVVREYAPGQGPGCLFDRVAFC